LVDAPIERHTDRLRTIDALARCTHLISYLINPTQQQIRNPESSLKRVGRVWLMFLRRHSNERQKLVARLEPLSSNSQMSETLMELFLNLPISSNRSDHFRFHRRQPATYAATPADLD